MRKELREIVEEFRAADLHISDGEAEDIEKYCWRKMEVAKVENKEEYLPLLFRDEVKNYLYRLAVNATSILMMIKKEATESVRDMQTSTMPSKMPECVGAKSGA